MLKTQLLPFTVVLLFFFFTSTGQKAAKTSLRPCMSCEEVINIQLPDVTISRAERFEDPVPHWKVSGIIGREIGFELLLPQEWNARFIMGGGGGFVGSVQNMAAFSVNNGFATVGTDTGH